MSNPAPAWDDQIQNLGRRSPPWPAGHTVQIIEDVRSAWDRPNLVFYCSSAPRTPLTVTDIPLVLRSNRRKRHTGLMFKKIKFSPIPENPLIFDFWNHQFIGRLLVLTICSHWDSSTIFFRGSRSERCRFDEAHCKYAELRAPIDKP